MCVLTFLKKQDDKRESGHAVCTKATPLPLVYNISILDCGVVSLEPGSRRQLRRAVVGRGRRGVLNQHTLGGANAAAACLQHACVARCIVDLRGKRGTNTEC